MESKVCEKRITFLPTLKNIYSRTALIDNDIWVFRVDATKSKDIIDSVIIGAEFFKVKPAYFLSSIYVKNLNAEGERTLDMKTLVELNKDLYRKTMIAIKEACEFFKVTNAINFHIYSVNKNYKIPADSLREALIEGGANKVTTDHRPFNYRSGSNDNKIRARIDTNMHVAKLKL